MGLFFIAAGSASKNRDKTLDKPHSIDSISKYLGAEQSERLRQHFAEDENIYLWGANDGRSFNELSKVKSGEYAVDVKNAEVVQIFTFCFFIKTNNTRLQEYVEWDKEKQKDERRPYKFVYFLKSPHETTRKQKNFFQVAFSQEDNQNWLVGQRYFNDSEVNSAIIRTSSTNIEVLLGLNGQPAQPPVKIIRRVTPPKIHREPSTKEIVKEQNSTYIPDNLKSLITQIEALMRDPGHLERDHEDLVASLFEHLGYERIHDIKFRRGNIDIRIDKDGKPQITIEVKADWKISPDSKGALNQAYNYANETGTRYVIITNGNRYCIYDRKIGLSYSDNLIADIDLTSLSDDDLKKLEKLRKGVLE